MRFQMVLRGIGSGRLLIAGCAIAAYGVVGVATAAYGDDWREVNEDIRDRIAMLQPPIGPHSIEIDNRGRGRVRLEGYVDTEASRQRVAQVAQEVEGVSRVDNELEVASKGSAPRNEEVAHIEEAIRREAQNGRYNVAITTSTEDVTLRGRVDSQKTKERVVAAASSVAKRPIVDRLVVEAIRSDADVQQSIRRILEEEYPRLAQGVTVSVRNGVASLDGDVASRRDVDKLLASVLMVEGVSDIQSNVRVRGGPYARPSDEQVTE